MKKNLIVLACASMIIFSAGCGDASNSVNNVKENPTQEKTVGIEEQAKNFANGEQTVQGVEKKFIIGGVFPTMTLAEVKAVLGEPVSTHDDDEFTFANGIMIEVTKVGNIVEEVKSYQAEVQTGLGISAGMSEQDLLNAYGKADSIDNDDGKVEYKYYSADRSMKIEFEVTAGIITEIKTNLAD